jgi:CelD/BcsL family acetyltransferase involved in cellulose biosynthesis
VDNDGRSYRILTSVDELLSIKTQWDRLWAEAEAEYFLCFSCMHQSWNAIHRPQSAELCCVVVCDKDRLLGVLPMITRRYTYWKHATTCGPRAAEGFDMLIAKSPESPAVATALLENLLKLARPDYVWFEYVRQGSHLEIAIQRVPSLRIIDTWDEKIPYADLKAETDWPSYKLSLNKRYEADCARTKRRLNELGKVTVEVVRGTPTPLIDWLFVHKQKWSERTHKRSDWVFSPYYKEYLGALFSSDPRFLVFALKLDEIPIAVKLLAINTNSASLIIITYDEKYMRFSPGKILDDSMMKYVFENYRRADGSHLDVSFGPGMEKFKLHWSRGHANPARSYRITVSRWGCARTQLEHVIAGMRKRMSAPVFSVTKRYCAR